MYCQARVSVVFCFVSCEITERKYCSFLPYLGFFHSREENSSMDASIICLLFNPLTSVSLHKYCYIVCRLEKEKEIIRLKFIISLCNLSNPAFKAINHY